MALLKEHYQRRNMSCLGNKTNKMACAPSEDSDQPGHPPRLIRVFAVRMKKAWADLSLGWAHSHFVGFVMRRLIFIVVNQN